MFIVNRLFVGVSIVNNTILCVYVAYVHST